MEQNELISKQKNSKAIALVATRFDKRSRNFAAAVILTVIRRLLRNAAKGIIESTTKSWSANEGGCPTWC